MEKYGHCLSCLRPGQKGRLNNFLCGDCANPKDIRSFCQKCRKRRVVAPEVARAAIKPIYAGCVRPGLAFVLSSCPTCSDITEVRKRKVKIYAIKPDASSLN